MTRFVCLIVLSAVLQLTASQGRPDFPGGPPRPHHPAFNVPEKCMRPPQNVEKPQECCQIKPLYSQEEFESCGANKEQAGPPDCSIQECLMAKKGLHDGKAIQYDALAKFTDEWLESNGDFKPALDKARSICMGEGGPPGPPHVCEANKLMFCIGAIMFSNCPSSSWQTTEGCKILKEHLEECKAPSEQ